MPGPVIAKWKNSEASVKTQHTKKKDSMITDKRPLSSPKIDELSLRHDPHWCIR